MEQQVILEDTTQGYTSEGNEDLERIRSAVLAMGGLVNVSELIRRRPEIDFV